MLIILYVHVTLMFVVRRETSFIMSFKSLVGTYRNYPVAFIRAVVVPSRCGEVVPRIDASLRCRRQIDDAAGSRLASWVTN